MAAPLPSTVSCARPRVTGVGPNGAGKSTTMRLVLGLDSPDEGVALVCGQPYRSLRNPLAQVGALLDSGALHPARKGRDHLLWLAYTNGFTKHRVDEVLEQVGLTQVPGVAGATAGNAPAARDCAALLGDPPVLMLDEPVNGLILRASSGRGLLRSLAADGRVVFVSSHLMSELEAPPIS